MSKESELKSVIARIPQATRFARERARKGNSPEARAICDLADLADDLYRFHHPLFQLETVADDFYGLGNVASKISFGEDADLSPESWLGELYSARSSLIGFANDIVRCAAALGPGTKQKAWLMGGQITIDPAAHQDRLDALLNHVNETRRLLDLSIAPEVQSPELEDLQKGVVSNYVEEMHIIDKGIRVTISIGEGIDLVVLERLVLRLAAATGEIAESIRRWVGRAAVRLKVGIEAVYRKVRQATGSIFSLIRSLSHGKGKGVQPEAPKIPDDFLEQARSIILAGHEPPAHWVPSITSLNFGGTGLSDTRLLSSLTALERLNLANTPVIDIAPIAGLTALKGLDLCGTEVVDITPIANFTALEILNLDSTRITDISKIAGLSHLRELFLGSTMVTDVTAIASLTALEELFLQSTPVTNVAPLSGLAALKTLWLADGPVSDLSPIANLAALKVLWLDSTQVIDIAPFAGLTALETLNLDNAKLSDITPLSGLVAMKELHIGGTEITDVVPISGLVELEILNLSGTTVSDIEPISGLTKLKELYLGSTEVKDIASIAKLEHVTVHVGGAEEAESLRMSLPRESKVKVVVN